MGKRSHSLGSLTAALAILSILVGCGNSVDRHIARLAKGGEEAEAAKISLSLARRPAIEPLLRAFQDRRYPAKVRAEMADALFRLYLREKEPRILETFLAALQEPEVEVRRSAVKILGDLGIAKTLGGLLAQLGREPDDEVRCEILTALGIMGLEEGSNPMARQMTTRLMNGEEKAQFTDLLVQLSHQEISDTLKEKILEWLEAIAQEKVAEAKNLVLKADLTGAKNLLLAARDLVPDSKNVNQQLGKFYYDNGEAEKGMKLLLDIGAALRVPRLARRPTIDGVLDDPGWIGAKQLTRFYQNIARMRAYPTTGNSEAYVGHRDGNLYIGIKGYEPTTANLTANAATRDENVWQDDCVEIFLDPDRDYRTYYQIVINSRGTVFDQHTDGVVSGGNREWNARFAHAVKVAETYWSLEIEIPLDQFGEGKLGSGAVWGGNIARIRIANASEYGQWVPTYGSALQPDRFGFLAFE